MALLLWLFLSGFVASWVVRQFIEQGPRTLANVLEVVPTFGLYRVLYEMSQVRTYILQYLSGKKKKLREKKIQDKHVLKSLVGAHAVLLKSLYLLSPLPLHTLRSSPPYSTPSSRAPTAPRASLGTSWVSEKKCLGTEGQREKEGLVQLRTAATAAARRFP
jgi:hypothetical protein